ncbi:MAG: TIGR00282 family metallophosphoesterase [Clostridia bacterium]|nr:TIGR00282 family metallophosphoesterase [Clostridia bacterium]
MRLLFYGDLVAKSGKDILKATLPELKKEFNVDMVVANGENSAGGLGINAQSMREIFDAGVNVITLGNHVWSKDDTYDLVSNNPRLIRPGNLPENLPGKGLVIFTLPNGEKVAIINLIGRHNCGELNQGDPFACADKLVKEAKTQTNMIFVDFHAEATSEKGAMAWHLDGRVGAVVGTHTHVQTADERILPRGTALLTDVGMTGPYDSILGVEPELSIYKLTTGMMCRYKPATGRGHVNAVVVDLDPVKGICREIIRINRVVEL